MNYSEIADKQYHIKVRKGDVGRYVVTVHSTWYRIREQE